MRRFWLSIALAAIASAPSCGAWAEPTFVNGVVIPGDTLDATRKPGANAGRLGFFSDLYYDPVREEWWALSDRGPGGGVLDYATRVQRFTLDVHPVTGRISKFRVKKTIKFTDPKGLLSAPTNPAVGDRKALNGLNPLALNSNVGLLGRSYKGRPDPARLAAEALMDADPAIRSTALETLAESGDSEATSTTAAEVLAHERDAGVLDRALAVLSEQEAMPLDPVLRFAGGDGDPGLRMRALSLLTDRGNEDRGCPPS
jgi:Esterase-like activity of phytase